MTTQVTFREILQAAPYFAKWMKKVPDLSKNFTTTPPWRLFIQAEEGGRWARADLPSYPKAYDALRRRLSDCHDAAVNCKVKAFAPPIIRVSGVKTRMPVPDGHHWCEYCRRPTVFKFFSKHPCMKQSCNPEELRCSICGARLNGLRVWKSSMLWPVS